MVEPFLLFAVQMYTIMKPDFRSRYVFCMLSGQKKEKSVAKVVESGYI